jgi:hypothetical protein
MIKFAFIVGTILSLPQFAYAQNWKCRNTEYELSVDSESGQASIRGPSTGRKSYALEITDFQSKRWRSGEVRIEFGFVGPANWENEANGNLPEGWASIQFDKTSDRYLAVLRLKDSYSSHLKLLPFMELTCK